MYPHAPPAGYPGAPYWQQMPGGHHPVTSLGSLGSGASSSRAENLGTAPDLEDEPEDEYSVFVPS